MQEIMITSKERIESDSKNYIFSVKTKTKEGLDKWYAKWYYPSLASCYNDLLDHYTLTKDKATLKENLEETVKLLAELKIKAKSGKYPEK